MFLIQAQNSADCAQHIQDQIVSRKHDSQFVWETILTHTHTHTHISLSLSKTIIMEKLIQPSDNEKQNENGNEKINEEICFRMEMCTN